MKQSIRTAQRRLNCILRNEIPPHFLRACLNSTETDRQGWNEKMIKLREEILNLQAQLELDKSDLFEIHEEFAAEKYRNKIIQRRKPTRVRKDNKTELVGSGGSNRNKVRYPKKCRKTAWKRFYKLFPKLDPKNHDKIS